MSTLDKVITTVLVLLLGGICEGAVINIVLTPNSNVPPELAIFGIIVVLASVIGILIPILKS